MFGKKKLSRQIENKQVSNGGKISSKRIFNCDPHGSVEFLLLFKSRAKFTLVRQSNPNLPNYHPYNQRDEIVVC